MESRYTTNDINTPDVTNSIDDKRRRDSITRWIVYTATVAMLASLIIPSIAFPGMLVALGMFGNIYWTHSNSAPVILTTLVMLIPTAVFYGFIGYVIGRVRNKKV
ncbi:MAG: hypothetical protein K0S38_938 [Candidatus Paceibacter sp.]|jgi:hypothetical protein|nr:hypothetical protein [Candidatus Paceibacter sp.]